MRPNNPTERKKRILVFAGLYAASFILIFFIFSAFGFHFTANDQKAKASASINSPAGVTDYQILTTDSLLHEKLFQLQKLDDQYTHTLADTASALERVNAAAAVDQYEWLLKNTIDSIEQDAAYAGTAKDARYSAMLGSFRSILNNRLGIKSLQASVASGKTLLPAGYKNMQEWKSDMIQKDEQIIRMGEQIKLLQGKVFAQPLSKSGRDEAEKGEIELLKNAFADLQKENGAMQEKYNRLKTENNNLASQVVEVKRASQAPVENGSNTNTSTPNAAQAKINMLEQKVEDLNADLYFTKVDCNLARADAQQIISNARQRKELLTESLAMLNVLAKYNDAEIQKKAKEKVIRLNHIATALRD